MRSKRFGVLSLVVLTIFVMTISAGCGGLPDTGKQESGSSTQTVQLSYTSWRTEDLELVNNLLKEFETDNPTIDVTFNPIKDMEYDAQIKTRFASGTADDILGLRSWDPSKILFEAGYLNEITTKEIPNLDKISEVHLAAWRSDDGNIYGLPGNWVANGFLYNTKIFEKYNLTPPKTWSQFFSICDTLMENGVTPISAGTKEPWYLVELFSDNIGPNFYGGEEWRTAMLEGKDNFLNPAFIDHLETMLKMKEYFPKGFEALGYFEAQQLFANEQAAIMAEGSWAPVNIKSLNKDLEIDFFPAPVVKEGDKQYVGFTPAMAYGVNKSSKYQKEIYTFLSWLASPKGAQLQNKMLPGQYCSLPDAGDIEDPLLNKWMQAGGQNGENLSIYWSFEKLQAKQPGAGDLAGEAYVNLMTGKFPPEQAAQFIQDGLASWYEPLKK